MSYGPDGVVEGAGVRVSMLIFDKGMEIGIRLARSTIFGTHFWIENGWLANSNDFFSYTRKSIPILKLKI